MVGKDLNQIFRESGRLYITPIDVYLFLIGKDTKPALINPPYKKGDY